MKSVDNVTLSIDLSNSWINSSVVINAIPKDPSVPRLNRAILWGNPNQTAFYLWGGQTSNVAINYPPPANNLWKFSVDGAGGSWSEVQVFSSTFESLVLQGEGCGLTVGDTGYFLGGFLSPITDLSASTGSSVAMPGIASLNFTSGAWSEDSTAGKSHVGRGISSRLLKAQRCLDLGQYARSFGNT